jgi:hypothetical protein
MKWALKNIENVVLNESRKRDGMEKIETKQAALFVNPNEIRKSKKSTLW